MFTAKRTMSAVLYTVNVMSVGSPGLSACGSSVLWVPPSRYALPLMASGGSGRPASPVGWMGSSGSNVPRYSTISCGVDASPVDLTVPRSRASAGACLELPLPPPRRISWWAGQRCPR